MTEIPPVVPGDPRFMTVLGARLHNLDQVNLSIPKGSITVFTGVSGSGKSSLVFGTLAAESRRRLNESHSAFVRHRLLSLGRPEADGFYHLPAAVVVDQKPLGGGVRSTVGTVTEIAGLLRLLFSRMGTPPAGPAAAFSFNNPQGMCPACQGLGTVYGLDLEQVIDRGKSLNQGAVLFPTFAPGTFRWKRYTCSGLFENDKPLKDFTQDEWQTFLYADDLAVDRPLPGWPPTARFQGLVPRFKRAYLDHTPARLTRAEKKGLETFVTRRPCPECGGARLNRAALACQVGGKSIADCFAMDACSLQRFIRKLDCGALRPVTLEIGTRLDQMKAMGLGYLSLGRGTDSLSGGESQRVKMVRHLGNSLSGIAYVFDEPGAGLHPRDISQLTDLIRKLRAQGNTVLAVSHDPGIIAAADRVVDLGPGAGRAGGRIVFHGPVKDIAGTPNLTGRWLSSPLNLKGKVRRPSGKLEFKDICLHNLCHLDFSIPTGVLTVVAGVAGSGKSTLARGVLPGHCPGAVVLDQRPLKGSSRSFVASFLSVSDSLRTFFAKHSGRSRSLFSRNGKGACPRCRGLGVIKTDLAFMENVETGCEACGGTGFNGESRSILWNGMSIADLLSAQAADLSSLLDACPNLAAALESLAEVGLSHLSLGRSTASLSGGERQRLKLARALLIPWARLYILDEPTSGLHGADTEKILQILDRLVDSGSTLVVVEHNPEVLARADRIIELGPGAGGDGGRVMFQGTPGQALGARDSVTGACLGARRSGRLPI